MAKSYYKAKNYKAQRSIGHLIRRASNLITCEIEALFADKDVTFVQYIILMHLREGMALTSADICQKLPYDSGALTRVIDQLEEQALLERKRSKIDRRNVELQLTTKGRKMAESLIPMLVELYNTLLIDFTHIEIDTLINLLTKFIGNISFKPKVCRAKNVDS